MADVTTTPTIQSLSFLNFASKYEFNDSMWSSSFLQCDGNWNARAKGFNNLIGLDQVKLVNLFYIPDLATIYTYDFLKLDKTVLDLTITELTNDLSISLAEQIDNTDVRFRFMQLNKYEFIIIFYIDCDYITDINLTPLQNTGNDFIDSYRVTKQTITPLNIVFKFWHRFK